MQVWDGPAFPLRSDTILTILIVETKRDTVCDCCL